MSTLTAVHRALDGIAALFEAVCIALLAAMLAINAVNIVARGGFDQSLNWVWPWTMVLFLYWVMLAFYPLYRRRKDVSIYAVTRFVGPRAERILGVVVHVAVMAAAGLLIYTIPERLASSRGFIEIVGLPRQFLIWPLLASTVPIFIDAAASGLSVALGHAPYRPFGTVEIAE